LNPSSFESCCATSSSLLLARATVDSSHITGLRGCRTATNVHAQLAVHSMVCCCSTGDMQVAIAGRRVLVCIYLYICACGITRMYSCELPGRALSKSSLLFTNLNSLCSALLARRQGPTVYRVPEVTKFGAWQPQICFSIAIPRRLLRSFQFTHVLQAYCIKSVCNVFSEAINSASRTINAQQEQHEHLQSLHNNALRRSANTTSYTQQETTFNHSPTQTALLASPSSGLS
jgi:hypothetical protein